VVCIAPGLTVVQYGHCCPFVGTPSKITSSKLVGVGSGPTTRVSRDTLVYVKGGLDERLPAISSPVLVVVSNPLPGSPDILTSSLREFLEVRREEENLRGSSPPLAIPAPQVGSSPLGFLAPTLVVSCRPTPRGAGS
jgi:hypothetical protein